MVTENNSQINQFVGGMNSDASVSNINANQYTEAWNIRISSYANSGDQQLNKQQQILPIEGLVEVLNIPLDSKPEILASTSTRDYGIIIYKTVDKWGILRFKNAISRFDKANEYSNITDYHNYGDFSVEETGWKDIHKVSVCTRYENDDLIKLYIADGINPIMVFNIAPSNENYIDNNSDVSKYKSYPKVIFSKPKFLDYINGNLKASIVSYSYQLYNKNGISTDISPACKFIPIGDYMYQADIKKIHGRKQGDTTNTGCKIQISNDKYSEFLNRIIVYRISYEQNGQTPTISIIYNGKFQDELTITDTGQQSISNITIEEYNSMSGVHIIPKVIETKDDYMFAADVKEVQSSTQSSQFNDWDSRAFQFNRKSKNQKVYAEIWDGQFTSSRKIYPEDLDNLILPSKKDADQINVDSCQKSYDVNSEYEDNFSYDKTGTYYGGSGPNVEWRFIITQKIGDASKKTDKDLPIGNIWNLMNRANPNKNISDFSILDNGVSTYYVKDYEGSNVYEKTNMKTSNEVGRLKNYYLTRSLRRDELYRFGIILYDEYGQPSPVKWIADIRTPNMKVRGFEISCQNGIIDGTKYECTLNVLGIAFKVNNLPDGCTGYEIVRCDRSFENVATISQGIVARSIKPRYVAGWKNNGRQQYSTYYSPTIYTSSFFICGEDYVAPFNNQNSDNTCVADNFENFKLYQFASPEICYQKESFKTLIDTYKYYLSPQMFIYGTNGDYRFRSKEKSPYQDYVKISPFAQNGDKGENYGHASWIFPSTNNCGFELFGFGDVNVGDWSDRNGKGVLSENAYVRDLFYRINPEYGVQDGNVVNAGLSTCAISNNSVYERYTVHSSNERRDVQMYGNINSCIKLYTSSTKVGDVWDNPKSVGEDIPVIDISLPDNLNWNDFDDSNKYVSKTSLIDGMQYCNVVAGAIFGQTPNTFGWASMWANNIKDYLIRKSGAHNYINTDFGRYQTSIFGPAGTCAILSVEERDDNNNRYKMSTSFGAANYLVNSGNNNLQKESNEFCTSNSVDMQSIAGTHLCNLRKRTTPYGGAGEQYRKTSAYYSDGDYFDKDDNWNAVFNGDCDVDIFEYVGLHKQHTVYEDDGSGDRTAYSIEIFYDVPVETQIRLYLEDGTMPYKNLENNTAGNRTSYVQDQPAQVGTLYSQSDPIYVYNTAYSSESRNRSHSSYSYEDQENYNREIDYRVRYSNKKENVESIDNWTKFQSSNFIDVDSNYGQITNLRSFKNNLFFWQRFATGLLSVNERAITQDNDQNRIILGTGGVLSRYDYIDTTAGMHEGQFCDTQSNQALYWYDYDNHEIKMYSEGIKKLSKALYVDGLLNKYSDKDIMPDVAYDLKNNEILFNVINVDNKNSSMVYNEQQNIFTSIYTVNQDDSVQFSNGMYMIKSIDNNISIAQWNKSSTDTPNSWDGILKTYIKYIVNKNPLTTKVFDNQEIVSSQKLDNREDKNTYFSKNHYYRWSTDLISTEDTLKNQMTLREGNYRYAIPRAINEQKFGLRMRGKYMECSIQNNNPTLNIGIQYIVTKFRQSWS